MAQWQRFVAIGDSFTEGLEDPGVDGRHRGWADRVAERLSVGTPGFEYANLAIRGRLLAPILADQLPAAVAMQPDLITIAGGVNDVLRPKWDLPGMTQAWDQGLALARSGGAHVLVVTFGQPSRRSRALGSVQDRLADYREVLLDLARIHGCEVVDFWYASVFDDPRFWADDRLHLSSLGHQRVADAVLESLGYPTADWLAPLPDPYDTSALTRLRSDAAWMGGHLAPWIGRRLIGRSSGDGITAKRPNPAPIRPANTPLDGSAASVAGDGMAPREGNKN